MKGGSAGRKEGGEDLLDDLVLGDGRDDRLPRPAVVAGQDIECVDPAQEIRPGKPAAVGPEAGVVLWEPAPPSGSLRYDPRAQRVIRRQHAVVRHQVKSWRWHKCGEPGDERQGLRS